MERSGKPIIFQTLNGKRYLAGGSSRKESASVEDEGDLEKKRHFLRGLKKQREGMV